MGLCAHRLLLQWGANPRAPVGQACGVTTTTLPTRMHCANIYNLVSKLLLYITLRHKWSLNIFK